MGELFPGKKLQNEGSGDSDGQSHEPRLDVDLDAGVIRVSGVVEVDDREQGSAPGRPRRPHGTPPPRLSS